MDSSRSSSHICHSEERSDEESFLYRGCEDPSLTLRMTWEGTLTEIFFILSIRYILKTALPRNLDRAVILMKNQISMMIGRIIGLRLVFLNRNWLRSFLMVDLMVAQSEILRA